MDESFCSTTAGLPKFPQDEQPNDNWTIEELLHWSLHQYHTKAIEQTSQNISSLRSQCEKECEDIVTMHTMAVDMAAKNKSEEEGKGGNNNARREEENNNPQSEEADSKPSSSSTTNNNNDTSSTKPSPSTIQVQVTIGPHTSSTYILRPKSGIPCLVGRSKGKKITNNGISLHKDQEVSTTHGKFLVEGGSTGLAYQTTSNSNNENNEHGSSSGGGGLKFYFIDVGSTNGTIYNNDKVLVPNERLLLSNGMEVKVGNSVLKIILG